MNVTPTHRSEYHNGREVGRYGRNLNASGRGCVFVWYHDGLRKSKEPAWAMEPDVEFKISISADIILVPDPVEGAVYSIDRDVFNQETEVLDGEEQYIARASDPYVRRLGDSNDVLNGNLWIESGNQIDEGYHKQQNEA